MFTLFDKIRNAGAAGLKLYFNSAYARYATMTELKIDAEKRQIEATLMLKGEREPLHVVLKGYEVKTTAGTSTLTFRDISTSREWLTAIAEEALKDRAFPIPSVAAKALQVLL